MKPLKDFWNYRVLGKTPPPARGRVDPHNPSVIAPGAETPKVRDRQTLRCKQELAGHKGAVYRAATGTWESFKDAKVKEALLIDDAAPPDEVQRAWQLKT